jgi:hypothetical protein
VFPRLELGLAGQQLHRSAFRLGRGDHDAGLTRTQLVRSSVESRCAAFGRWAAPHSRVTTDVPMTNAMAKFMNLRRDDRCAQCGCDLPTGTRAVWLAEQRAVECEACYSMVPAVIQAAPLPEPAGVDRAGGSARVEYERRSARELAKKEQRVSEDAEWRRTIKEERPVLGRVAAAFTPRPTIGPASQPTRAWNVGAEGEERVAEVLADVAGIEVLHDRLVPRSRANIDHIVLSSSGVYVIDAKKYSGRLEVRDVGGFFKVDERLYVAGRDRTRLVDGVDGQIDVVRTALGAEFDGLPVHGVLCFIGCEWGLRARTKVVKGVAAVWPLALVEHVSQPGPHGPAIAAAASLLRERLRPAAR